MWICTNKDFISVVECRNNKSCVLVRARRKQDLDFLGNIGQITQDKMADYRYRIVVCKNVFSDIMSNLVENINYDNFKDSVSKEDINLNRFYFMI